MRGNNSGKPQAVIIDNADDLTNVNAIQKNPVDYDWQLNDNKYSMGYNGGSRRKGSDKDWFMRLIVAIIIVGGAAWILWSLIDFVKDTYLYNDMFRSLVDFSLFAIIFSGTITLCLLMFSLFRYTVNKLQMTGIVRLPGGFVAHVSDIAGGWNRANVRAMVESIVGMHFDVQGRAADQSLYRSMQYYTPSTTNSSSSTNNALTGGNDENDSNSAIPSMANLLDDGLLMSESGDNDE